MTRDNKQYEVLIVEDNLLDFARIQDLLRKHIVSPIIAHAETYAQVCEVLSEWEGRFDVVLLDLNLPDKGGLELIRDVRKLAPSYPVIILTGREDIEFSITSISQGISDYLVKDSVNAMTLYKSILFAIERNKITSKLLESEHRFSSIFQLSPQPMLLFDPPTLQFIQVNKAALQLYGYSETEFLKLSLPDLKIDQSEIGQEAMRRINIAESSIFSGTFQHRKKSGEIIDVRVYSVPIVVEGRMLRSVIVHDITEKKRFEATLTKAIIKAQEEERYEVGAELHDNICQILATSNLGFGMITEEIPPGIRPLFIQSKQALVRASKEIRKLSHRLAPAFYDSETLQDAVLELLKTFDIEGKYRTSMAFETSVREEMLSKEMKLCVYRILQEQLKNILTYAQGSQIDIQFSTDNGNLLMKISDNGVGFDLSTARRGIGLENMQRRTRLLSGKLNVISAPGKGCIVSVEIPLPAV